MKQIKYIKWFLCVGSISAVYYGKRFKMCEGINFKMDREAHDRKTDT